jgi:hypothetical protein
LKTDWTNLERYRKTEGVLKSNPGEMDGAFFFRCGTVNFTIIASSGSTNELPAWEHVSVRAEDYRGSRIPTWLEMCWVKDMFWEPEECVVQFHPPKSDYVNNHPHVLHLWKPLGSELPRPPSILVGIK